MTPGKSEGSYMREHTVWTLVFLDWLNMNEYMAKQRWIILMKESITLVKFNLNIYLLNYFRVQNISNVIFLSYTFTLFNITICVIISDYTWLSRLISFFLTNIYSVYRSEISRVVQICAILLCKENHHIDQQAFRQNIVE